MRALVLAAALLLPGCALLGKSQPLVPRYFSAEYEGDPAAARAPAGLSLRLGQVQGWTHLRERMVVRRSSQELAYREDRRWTERPEVYLRRALSRTLFEERGLVESLSGRGVTLEVELLAFDSLAGPPRARLQARLLLRDDRAALLAETVTVEQPVAEGGRDGTPERLAEAFSEALHRAVTSIADRVVVRLVAGAAPSRTGEVAQPSTRSATGP
jgi:cholesterol transport system auxiliary component